METLTPQETNKREGRSGGGLISVSPSPSCVSANGDAMTITTKEADTTIQLQEIRDKLAAANPDQTWEADDRGVWLILDNVRYGYVILGIDGKLYRTDRPICADAAEALS